MKSDKSTTTLAENAKELVSRTMYGDKVPRGLFYSRPLRFEPGTGGELIGVGGGDQARADGAWRSEKHVATVLCFVSDNSAPHIEINRARMNFRDIMFVGCPQPDNRFENAPVAMFNVYQPKDAHPVGHTTWERCTVTNCREGWLFGGRPGSHADHNILNDCIAHDVIYPYVIDENQSVAHHIKLTVKGNTTDTIIWAKNGGRVRATIDTVGSARSLLSIGNTYVNEDGNEVGTGPTRNNGKYEIDCHMDGKDHFDWLIEERWADRNHLSIATVNCFAPESATFGNEVPIMRKHAHSQLTVNLERVAG